MVLASSSCRCFSSSAACCSCKRASCCVAVSCAARSARLCRKDEIPAAMATMPAAATVPVARRIFWRRTCLCLRSFCRLHRASRCLGVSSLISYPLIRPTEPELSFMGRPFIRSQNRHIRHYYSENCQKKQGSVERRLGGKGKLRLIKARQIPYSYRKEGISGRK